MSAVRFAIEDRRPTLEEEVRQARAMHKRSLAWDAEWRRQEEEELRQSVAGLTPKGGA